jgi:hypothetical protein
MLTRSRAVVLALAGLSLAACSNVHPGSAAYVEGRSISMRTLDKTAEAYCTLTADAARQQGVTTVSNSDVRRQAVVGLVSLVVARDLAKDEKLSVPASSYRVTPTQRERLETAFPNADVDELARVLEESQEVSAIAVALAEKQTNQQATAQNQEQFAELGQRAILAAFKKADVSFAPRFGLDPGAQARAETGSISVAPVDLEAPVDEELPRALRCS